MISIFHDGHLPEENNDKRGFDLDDLMFFAIAFFLFALGLSIIISLS